MGCVNCPNPNSKSSTSPAAIGTTDLNYEKTKSSNQLFKTPDKVNSSHYLGGEFFSSEIKKKIGTSSGTSVIFTRKQSLTTGFPTTEMLKEINNARESPNLLIDKIIELKSNILTYQDKQYIKLVDKFGKLKYFNLPNGVKAIDNCLDYLKKISKENSQLNKLIMKEELKLPLPVGNTSKCIDKEYIKGVLNFKMVDLNKQFKILDFHYDICVPSPVNSVLLQIIDDTNDNYQRRKNIFNPKAKYIGIAEGDFTSSLKCYYLLFADKA